MKQHTVLVVEDDFAIRSLYALKLEMSGHAVFQAENGKKGLELAADKRPDLILLDLKMPVLSGDDMLEQLRATEWGAIPRVIVLTNISRSEAPAKLRFLNVDRYVVKAHTTPAQLVDIIAEVLA